MALILWLHYLVYILNILKFYVRYLPNISCPYYKFIHTILLYFLKLLQMTFLILIYLFILIKYNKKTKFKNYLWPNFLNGNILLHNDHNDDDIRMVGKIIILLLK